MDLPMYHGSISREACQELLSSKGKDGSFLIRDSETIQGALCLCVYKQKVVYTYRILQTHSGYYTLQTSAGVQERFFKTLVELVQSYREKDQGLASPLRYPVKRRMRSLAHAPDNTPEYENVDAVTKHGPVLPP
ncbi:SH2 domain-containing protein 1A [Megalops cyprinoides]|uniref:SH2 domain-containing protein 1A n=1 Tax=Megalops cyprinoides TaxID=118141 RepID=UPI001864EBC6|nr:SH2 domain-containing protein 1A [Megalops cyprinoides]